MWYIRREDGGAVGLLPLLARVEGELLAALAAPLASAQTVAKETTPKLVDCRRYYEALIVNYVSMGGSTLPIMPCLAFTIYETPVPP
jgi:hypothetical protein